LKETPIVLNNFNRLTSTRNMFEFLKGRNFTNIVILDNASTYPPLLDWYATLKDSEVVRFPTNIGAHCLFDSGYLKNYTNSEYIVYSDSDLELNPLMPDNFLEIMKSILLKYNERKIGLALSIDDVPENCFRNFFTGSLEWERQFWTEELEKDVYRAMVDTTFCLLHQPETHDLKALRIAGNFTARHLPWYQEYSTLSEEEMYFIENANAQSNFRNGYFNWLEEKNKSQIMLEKNKHIKGENKYFIAVYTNIVKDYCEEQFFSNLFIISRGEPVFVIDNTLGDSYYNKLQWVFRERGYDNFSVFHLAVPEHPKESQFQRNVCDSVNFLRDMFLQQTNLPYFLIVESDVVSPADLLDRFEESTSRLNIQNPGWGIIGGLYYQGFHNYDFDSTQTSLERTGHCLSGCTLYKRELIEKYPFRYDPGNLGSFPDALISYDSGAAYSLWNEHRIKCDHLHNPVNGLRVSAAVATEIPYLMPHQMEPFNGDTFIEQEFLKLRDQFDIDTVVETGTCFGSTTQFLGKHFKRVISIEINEGYLQIARTRIGGLNNVHTFCGASEKILSNLLGHEAPVNDRTIFYLDAHWDTHCPLPDELRIIAEHKIQPIIAIHDFQVPGQPGLAFDSYGGQPFTFDWLKPLFDNIYGEGGYDHYYNAEPNATEIKVGIIYITPKQIR
jgi:hypothetical protein